MTDHLLIIEDTRTMAELYAKYLSCEDRTTDIAASGKDGLSRLSQKNYSAIILDLNLPDMDGLDILKHIQTSHPSIPVIVVTAYGSVGSAADAMKFGAFDFIMKPFSSARLNATIKVALDYATIKNELLQLKNNMFDSLKKLPQDCAALPTSS